MKKQILSEEFKRMQKLAGIILKEDIKKNQDYFNRYTSLDPNEGKNIKVTAPFTVDKIASAIMPLVDKQGEGLNSDNLAEFKEWLKVFMFKYSSLLKSDNITVRDLFDNMYGDYIMEVNELSNDDDDDNSYQLDNPDLNKYDGPTKTINGIPHTWLGSGYFPADQEGIDIMKTSFVQDQEDKVDKIISQKLKGKKEIKDNSKIKYFIVNPNYNPADFDEVDEDEKYLINTEGITDAIKKYAAQNNLEIDSEDLNYYEESLDSFGYDYGSGDFDRFEERGGYDMKVTPTELYREFISMTYDRES